MSLKTAHSSKLLPEAVADLKRGCGNLAPRAILCFASTKYDPAALSAQMQGAFPDACLVGCTTAGEIAGGTMMNGSVVAMFLDEDIVEDAGAAVVHNLRGAISVREAFVELENHFRRPISSMDIRKHVGVVLADGLSGAEEKLMERIGDCTDLTFVGGSAGDDLKFKQTHVLAKGQAHTDAAVLLLLRLKRGFEIIKTQSFKVTGKQLVATKVDEASRTVLEFDGVPAVEAYAKTLGVVPEEIQSHFRDHPLGLMIDGEPFVRSPQRRDGGSIVFYCQIKEGMELQLLEATDIVAATRSAVEGRKKALGRVAGVIDFQCILRAQQLRAEGRCDQYGAVFSGFPSVGFSTYGEEYLGHINQTSTMLVFR